MSRSGSSHEDLGVRLKDARKLAGLSQAQVAEMMGLHRPSVSEIEAGRRRVSSDELLRFSEIYGVATAWLLGEVEDELSLQALVAARELQKMKPEDLDALVDIITAIRGSSTTSE